MFDVSRSSLPGKIVKTFVCALDWLRSSQTPFSVEENLEDFENFGLANILLCIIMIKMIDHFF